MGPRIAIQTILNHPVDSNCYIISRVGEKRCILVDPALDQGPELDAELSRQDLQPEYIILTHEHFDHISSVEYIRQRYACEVIASARCSINITSPKKNLSLFYDQRGFTCAPADIVLTDEEYTLGWHEDELHFFYTPGHSEGGICFSIAGNLFTGDTLMGRYKPVTKLPGGNKAQLEKSIKMLLDRFDGDTIIYPGHGEADKLSTFKV